MENWRQNIMEEWRRNYIRANTNACVNNCICFYLWKNQSFKQSIQDTMDHVRKYHYCDPESMKEAIVGKLKTMIHKDGVNKFIAELKQIYVSLSYKTVKDFIAGEYEIEGLTAQGIANIVSEQLQTI